MRKNRRFSEMRVRCMNESKMRELHAKCVKLGWCEAQALSIPRPNRVDTHNNLSENL